MRISCFSSPRSTFPFSPCPASRSPHRSKMHAYQNARAYQSSAAHQPPSPIIRGRITTRSKTSLDIALHKYIRIHLYTPAAIINKRRTTSSRNLREENLHRQPHLRILSSTHCLSAVSAVSAVNPWLQEISLDTQLPILYNIHLTNRGFLIWRTKLPLKPSPRFIGNPSSGFCLLSSPRTAQPAQLARALHLSSALYKSAPFYAKRTQFSKGQIQCNRLCRKGLREQTTPAPLEKTNPIQTQFPCPQSYSLTS